MGRVREAHRSISVKDMAQGLNHCRFGGPRGLDPPYKARLHPTEHFNESIIGTGFYRFGEVNHDDCISLTSLGYDTAQIATLRTCGAI